MHISLQFAPFYPPVLLPRCVQKRPAIVFFLRNLSRLLHEHIPSRNSMSACRRSSASGPPKQAQTSTAHRASLALVPVARKTLPHGSLARRRSSENSVVAIANHENSKPTSHRRVRFRWARVPSSVPKRRSRRDALKQQRGLPCASSSPPDLSSTTPSC
jgi:hypothetical protein